VNAAVLFFIILVSTSQVWSQSVLYSIGEPSAAEQYYLELINRARANPTAEGQRLAASGDPDVERALQFYGVNVSLMKKEFAVLPSRPPLAMNAKLMQMARGHTLDLFSNAFQGHTGSNGSTITQRANATGYAFSTLGENVYSYAESVFQGHAGFQVDWGREEGDNDGMQTGRGHRMNIHGDYREIGIGAIFGTNRVQNRTVGPQVVTQNFGSQLGSSAYITGVAYYDLNSNGFYDPGEGIGGIHVQASGAASHAVTSNSGGYAIPVTTANSQYTVNFTGANLQASTSTTIANGENVKVDFKPFYVSPTPTGPTQVNTTSSNPYTFAPVGGAISHEWQVLKITSVPDDEAENLSRITATTSGNYTPRSTNIKYSGSAAYRLTHPSVAFSSELLTYNTTFLVRPGASLSFQSRLRMATVNQFAKVQISTDGGTIWQDVYSQKGATAANQNGQPGEANFNLRTISLTAYEGQQIRLRFNYNFSGGTLFPGTAETYGWYIDRVNFNQLVDVSNSVITPITQGLSGFTFQATSAGNYLLSVRPIIGSSSWPFSPPLLVTVLGGENPVPLVITRQPQDQAVKVGTTALLSVEATPSNLSYQWKKNGAIIPTGNHPVLSISQTTLADAGTYQVELVDASMNKMLSEPASLGVIFDAPKSLTINAGKIIKLTAKAAGPSLTYQWKKDGQPLSDTVNVTGSQTANLNLKNLQADQSGLYACEVRSGDSQPTEGGTTQLSIIGGAPSILANQTMLDSIVGGSYQHTILYNVTDNPPTTFRAKGLPLGLKLNAKTGLITGVPTKTGPYRVTLIAANSYGSTETTADLFVHPFPMNLSGNYMGVMINDPTLNQSLGARLDLKVSSLGAYTGSLTSGNVKTPFKGKLSITTGNGAPSTQALIQPTGNPKPTPFTLTLSFDLINNTFAMGSQLNLGDATLPIAGWRQIWDTKNNPATAYQGLHTFAIKLTHQHSGNNSIPQGHGFGSFNSAANGKLKITGRTADGEKYIMSSFVGPDGEIAFYQTLYSAANKGSLGGIIVLEPGSASEPESKTLMGSLYWVRPPNSQPSARVYRSGFGLSGTPVENPVLLLAVGAFYHPPQGADAIILGLQPRISNAQLEIAHGGFSPSIIPLDIAPQSKIKPSVDTVAPAKFKLTVNAKTGLITGSLNDNGENPSTKNQKVTLQGILTRENNQPVGLGYLLHPSGPAPSPIESGSMILRP
jgi:hypothetical protein